MQDTAGEARMNSSVMYSYRPPHMAKQKQDGQLELTYSSYVRIRNVALKTCQKRWMIGRSVERGSGISVLVAPDDDDDDDDDLFVRLLRSIKVFLISPIFHFKLSLSFLYNKLFFISAFSFCQSFFLFSDIEVMSLYAINLSIDLSMIIWRTKLGLLTVIISVSWSFI